MVILLFLDNLFFPIVSGGFLFSPGVLFIGLTVLAFYNYAMTSLSCFAYCTLAWLSESRIARVNVTSMSKCEVLLRKAQITSIN